MRARKVFRLSFMAVSAVTLVYCVLGIIATGPVTIRPPRFEIPVMPSATRLEQDVRHLRGPLSPRNADHPANLSATAAWLAAEFRAAGLQVEIQRYEVEGRPHANVIAVQPGSDPFRGAVVVGAHYDQGADPQDDNATGVAALLELVRTVPQRYPRRTRYFAAFDTGSTAFLGTDDMGSDHFARELARRESRVDVMVSLDGVGHFDGSPGSQRPPRPWLGWLYPDRGNFVAVMGDTSQGPAIGRVRTAMQATRALPVVSFRAPAWFADVNGSDHSAFRRLDLPAVMVTDTGRLRGDGSTRYLTDAGRIDFERMASAVHAVHGVLWEVRLKQPRSGTAKPF